MFSTDNWAMLQRVSPRLTGYAYAMTQDQPRAAALVQEAILTAMERRRVPGDEAGFGLWLMRILRPLCLPGGTPAEEATHGFAEPGADRLHVAGAADDLALNALNALVVRQGFFALPAEHRDSLALIEIAGFGYDEAARLVGIGRAAMAARVSAAREALLAALAEAPVVPFPRAMSGRRHV